MRQIDRRLLQIEEAHRRISLSDIPPLYVRYVGHEDLCPYGATEFEQTRYDALVDQINAYVDDLVQQHGSGILRDHAVRNDAYGVLNLDELEFVEHMLVSYRPGAADDAAA